MQKLICIDSTIRESLRRNPLQIRGLLREVMPRNGITLPDGNHIPQGTWIAIPFQAVHMDERFYPKSEDFDPFRFARMRTEGDRLDSTQTSDTYLAFSYGRHSWSVFSRYALLVPKPWCPGQTFIGLLLTSPSPGRWLVSQTLKLLIAYITLNYDIQPLDKRPPNTVFADTNIPSFSTRIKVRRMKQGRDGSQSEHGFPV